MKSYLLVFLAVVGLCAATTSPALAASHSGRGNATYNSNGVRFSYPKSWQKVSKSDASTFGQELTKDSGGIVKLAAVGGVESLSNGGASGCVAVLTKMKFTPAFQKKLKGNRQKFLQKFKQGVTQSGAKVLSSGTGRFAGQSKAFELQVQLKVDGTWTRDQFFVAITSNNKNVDMATFIVLPQSQWNKYSSSLASVAASSRFS